MNKLMLFFSVLISLSISADLKNDLEKQIGPLMDKVIEWRHDIHQNPELSNREYRTARKIEAHLRSLDIKVQTKIAYTGVVGLIEGDLPGPTIALRADMDALPVVEKTGLPFASKDKTKYLGQTVGIMHACGHDAHVAILMGVAEFLAENKDQLKGQCHAYFPTG
jgi:amidohydrolase